MNNIHLTPSQIEQANNLTWYHALDFGDYQTIGRLKPPLQPNCTLFGVMDLLSSVNINGMKCLDVGTAHGVISLGMAILGGTVSATDIGEGTSRQIRLASDIYGVNIDYHSPVYLEHVQNNFEYGTFDLIVCAGVMYHLFNPADVFTRLRPLLKRDGLLVVESACALKETRPTFVLNSETGDYVEPTTYFLPSPSAMTGLAKLCCLDVLATRTCSPGRFTLIGRATLPEEVMGRTPQCKKIHEFGVSDPVLNIRSFTDAERSLIKYSGDTGQKFIDRNSYKPDWPSHPTVPKTPLGKAAAGEALKALVQAESAGRINR